MQNPLYNKLSTHYINVCKSFTKTLLVFWMMPIKVIMLLSSIQSTSDYFLLKQYNIHVKETNTY